MKHCLLLLLAGLCASAPVEKDAADTGSCTDPQAAFAAELAVSKINADRTEGYIFRLQKLANVQVQPNGESGWVFYLTLDVVETDCHVLSKKDWKTCEARPTHDTPVYGQCKASLYVNKPHRVNRLYKYKCTIRPAPAARVAAECPDCPSHIALDNEEIVKTATLSLEKFNKEKGLPNYFALQKITRATSQSGMAEFYNVEYIVQETTCSKTTDETQLTKCPLMQCEFAHKGLCKGSHSHSHGEEFVDVECEIFEPEAGEREKQLHLLGGETDHSHSDKHSDAVDQTHDAAHDAAGHAHDHVHDHTKPHQEHEKTEVHAENSEHHHTHDHGHDHGPTHAHDHAHDHGHGHDHVHAHHAKAHDHSGDAPNQHHDYKHTAGDHTHEHDHEHALDHDHKHTHLHEHEHHHHHHGHDHEDHHHHHPEGVVREIPALDQPMTLPSFPDEPVGEVGVTLPLVEDPQIPGEKEPTIVPFPTAVGANCPGQVKEGAENSLVAALFSEDAFFKVAA